jgi:phosphodiesterase/alkaline phosphatase D-like protein
MRRTFFSISALVVTPLALHAGDRITHGPILGRVTPTSIRIWARTELPNVLQVSYGTAPDQLDRNSMPVPTYLAADNTGVVRLANLKPNTKYWYRVREGPGGSFRTLPDPVALRDQALNPRGLFNFQFEFACGNNQTPGRGLGPDVPAFKTMLDKLQDRIHFAILNGDWLYEDKRDHTVAVWQKQAGGLLNTKPPYVVQVAPQIVGVWENYKVYLERGKHLAEWHRHVPSLFTFDDHEILNDVWGAGEPGVKERRAVFRDIGVHAWYDYLGWANPIEFKQRIHFGIGAMDSDTGVLVDAKADFTKLDLTQAGTLHVHWDKPTAGVDDNALDDEPPGNKNAGVYGIDEILDKTRLRVRPKPAVTGSVRYSIGRRSYWRERVANCDIFALDTRGHREMHDTGNRAKKGLSMLGAEQKRWLMDGMKTSKADFLFVVSSVNLMVPHVGGGAVRAKNKDDAWTAFLDEREQLIRFWDGLGKPVFVLTGDLHNSFAIKISERVWEFASGPHNSQNHLAKDEGGRPANGVYDSFGRKCDIRWSSYFRDDVPREQGRQPFYCVVQVNNVFDNPLRPGETRWVAYPRPHVIVQYYDGLTGALRYAESVPAAR